MSICARCSTPFTPKPVPSGGMLYGRCCSNRCKKAYSKPLEARSCAVCDGPMKADANPAAKTCSEECRAVLYKTTKRRCRTSLKNELYNVLWYQQHKDDPDFKAKAKARAQRHVLRHESPDKAKRRRVREAKKLNATVLAEQRKRDDRIRFHADADYREKVLSRAATSYAKNRKPHLTKLYGVYNFFRSHNMIPTVLGGAQKAALAKIALQEAIANGFPIPPEFVSLAKGSNNQRSLL